MENDPIADYQAKIEERDKARAAVEKMTRTIQLGTEVFERSNWQDILNSFDKEMPEVTKIGEFFPIKDWPTGEQIKQLLSQWRIAQQEVQEAYLKVPEDKRKILRSPQDKTPVHRA